MKIVSLLFKIIKVATLKNYKLTNKMYFNNSDHVMEIDKKQHITTRITSSEVNFLISSQIILCNLNLYS
jgi:hypothetical protein